MTLAAHRSLFFGDDVVKSRSFLAYMVLNVIAVTAMAACVVTANKIVEFWGVRFVACNVILAFFTFPITDIISEIWGKHYANRTVTIAFGSQVFFVMMMEISVLMPSFATSPHPEAYDAFFSSSPRILFASMVAFLLSQYCDVLIYAKLKRLCKGKWLWIRNNVSTCTSQLVNAIFFISISFYGKQELLPLIAGSLIVRWIAALIDTPVVYAGVFFIHRYLKGETIAFTAEE